jgi:hypothetical protein
MTADFPASSTSKPAAASTGELVATAQHLVFEPGLYAVQVVAEQGPASGIGLTLPCIRIEPVPPTPGRPGRASFVDAIENGWLWRRANPAFMIVVGGRAGAILTIYRANDGMAAPEIRIAAVQSAIGAGAVAAVPAESARTAPPVPVPDPDTAPLTVLAHVTRAGDVVESMGGWIGKAGEGMPIEGFSLTPSSPLGPEDIEYQAILSNNWSTPWFSGGQFCGSRGLMLPLLGFRARLTKADAAFELTYSGRFADGQASGPHRDGESCHVGDAPLEAMQVVLRRGKAAEHPVALAPPAAAPVAPRKQEQSAAAPKKAGVPPAPADKGKPEKPAAAGAAGRPPARRVKARAP